MHTIRTLICITLALALGACASIGLQTDGQRIAAACAGASASLNVLAAANELGKLSSQQRASVIAAVGVIAPICSAEVAPTLDDVKREAFLAAITGLELAATQATKVQP